MRRLPDLPLPDTDAGEFHPCSGFAMRHESAIKHVTGEATYVDDLPEPRQLIHAAVGWSPISCGRILNLNLRPVRKAPGVVELLTLSDVPGTADIGPVYPGDPLLTDSVIRYYGQPIFVVGADSLQAARHALSLAEIEYEEAPPLLDARLARRQQAYVRPPYQFVRGDVAAAIEGASHRLSGALSSGAQEHFYLEGQAALALPAEDGGMMLYCSSQHPAEVQKLVAGVLGQPLSQVTVEVRRMGGAFGGKETQAAQWACLAAVLAHKCRRPVKLRLPRGDDMVLTGKRHPFHNRYSVGYDHNGRLLGAEIELIADCGHSPDLSDAVVDRAMFHADNAYYLPTARIQSYRCFTNKVSNTAFRGFGGPQGMLIIERAMDDIARSLGRDPLDIRKINLYGPGRDMTPYQQQVAPAQLPALVEQLEQQSDYRRRREEIATFNQGSALLRRGLALTPVKFGIAFTLQHLNQAGALLHIYTDGSIHLNHGGTEMGQGLNTKVAQLVADELQVDLERIAISAARTDKVPNSSPTAASSGTELNGRAALNAARILKQRLIAFVAETHDIDAEAVWFAAGRVHFGAQSISFTELVQAAYLARISLSASGYFRTPKIAFDRDAGRGRPFLYYANGAAVAEVVLDSLTGEYRVLRVDILHDVGQSLNPALDIGQIEGGFIQGMGWLTTEELKWDAQGRLLSNSPANYKIPAIGDTPPEFNIALFDQPNSEETVYRAKAVGEPPLMLAISVWSALRDAISSLDGYRSSPELDVPATPERVLQAIKRLGGEPDALE